MKSEAYFRELDRESGAVMDRHAEQSRSPAIELPDDFIESVAALCDIARMSGGVAGRDIELCRHLDRVEQMLEAVRDPDWQAGARGEFRMPSDEQMKIGACALQPGMNPCQFCGGSGCERCADRDLGHE